MNETDFARLPDCGEGLSNRLSAAVQTAASLDELYRQVQTKRYPLARIRRLILWGFLGLTAADRPAALPYLRRPGLHPPGASPPASNENHRHPPRPRQTRPRRQAPRPRPAGLSAGSTLYVALRPLPERLREDGREE